MNLYRNSYNDTQSTVDVSEIKCAFANLKYEQLMADKYFIKSISSKEFVSYPAEDRRIDMLFKIAINEESKELCH